MWEQGNVYVQVPHKNPHKNALQSLQELSQIWTIFFNFSGC